MIELANVHVAFDGLTALDGLSVRVPAGTLFGVMGPLGAGKTVMCKVACGLLQPDSGTVVAGGVELTSAKRDALAAFHARCGVQFQSDALFEHMTVIDNICYPLRRLTDLGQSEIRARSMERLAMVGLAGFEDRMPSRLSGGQRRRVALARACVTDPEILICDDPTAGLDPVTSRRILDMIAGIRYQVRNTVVVVSSDVLGLLSVAERAALIWQGKVIAEGSPSELAADSREELRRFLEDAKLPFGGQPWD